MYHYFYPRSPCGERQFKYVVQCRKVIFLSTLSLRRATVCVAVQSPASRFLSTLSLRRATRAESGQQRSPHNFYPRSPCGERLFVVLSLRGDYVFLSTLSLRRATRMPVAPQPSHGYFYPRSPCGERLTILLITVTTLLFLSTLSLRRATTSGATYLIFLAFLSTLSLRRATEQQLWQNINTYISIHALLAESDYY